MAATGCHPNKLKPDVQMRKKQELDHVVGSGHHSCGVLEGSVFGGLQFPTNSSSNIHPPARISYRVSLLFRSVRVMANAWPVLRAASGVFVDVLMLWPSLAHEVLTLGSRGLWTCMASDLQFHAVLPLDEVWS